MTSYYKPWHVRNPDILIIHGIFKDPGTFKNSTVVRSLSDIL